MRDFPAVPSGMHEPSAWITCKLPHTCIQSDYGARLATKHMDWDGHYGVIMDTSYWYQYYGSVSWTSQQRTVKLWKWATTHVSIYIQIFYTMHTTKSSLFGDASPEQWHSHACSYRSIQNEQWKILLDPLHMVLQNIHSQLVGQRTREGLRFDSQPRSKPGALGEFLESILHTVLLCSSKNWLC